MIKNIFRILLTALFIQLSFFNANAFAYQLSEDTLRSMILSAVEQEAKGYTDGDIEVSITGLLYTPVKTRGGNLPEVKVISNSKKFMHRDIKRVLITENGTKLASFPVNVTVKLYRDVVVAKDNIKQYELLTEYNTEIKRMEVGIYHNKIIPALNSDKPTISMRNFAPGSLILTSYTRTKPDIVRNTGVNIVFESEDGLQIEMEGIALGEGNTGESVLVRNNKYNKVHSGIVIGENTVKIRI